MNTKTGPLNFIACRVCSRHTWREIGFMNMIVILEILMQRELLLLS